MTAITENRGDSYVLYAGRGKLPVLDNETSLLSGDERPELGLAHLSTLTRFTPSWLTK